jgi:hypothetical protein
MTDSEMTGLDLAQVLARFPDRAALVAQLANGSETFRSLCEDYVLASTTLARLSSAGEAERRSPIVEDYQLIVAELEKEIAATLSDAAAAG